MKLHCWILSEGVRSISNRRLSSIRRSLLSGKLPLRWRHNEHDGVSNHLTSRLFTQASIQAQIKESIKAPRDWPLWGEFTGHRWIPRTKGQLRGKRFHSVTSSWLSIIMRSYCMSVMTSQFYANFWINCLLACTLLSFGTRILSDTDQISGTYFFLKWLKLTINPHLYWRLCVIKVGSCSWVYVEKKHVNITSHFKVHLGEIWLSNSIGRCQVDI